MNYDISEVYQFAIGIENNGEMFYKRLAKEIEDEDIRNFFNNLANDEMSHKKTFESMLSKIKEYKSSNIYPDEYFAYLRAYVKDRVFPSEISKETLKEVENLIFAVNYSIDLELESIFYYTEIKSLLPTDQKGFVDDIISEERKHFSKLFNLLKTLE